MKIYRKILIELFVLCLKIIPLKRNKVILWSNSFKDIGCNPKYIAEYLSTKYPKQLFDIVYVVNKDLQIPKNIPFRTVEFFSKRYLYELTTSKIIITNHRIPDYYFFRKRKKQIYIQTWHSSIRLKKIEKDACEDLSQEYIDYAIKDSRLCDYIISGCEFSSKIFKNSFWYNGDILNFGTPRSDILITYRENTKTKVKEYFGIKEIKNIILYAPTFRKEDNSFINNINYEEILYALKQKYGKEWVFLVRCHPNIKDFKIDTSTNVYNASLYPDIQELIAGSDILLTDYSSCMFDFALSKKPCFLYLPDHEKYISKERDLYFEINKLPFLVSYSCESLINQIENFSEDDYIKECDNFLAAIGSYEDGMATARICDFIYKQCFNLTQEK